MSLRKPPTRSEAFLAANRRNAQKSTGPRTQQGKSAIVFNSLRHGHRSRRLFETLRRSSLALQRDFARIYAALYTASKPGRRQVPLVLLAAAYIWAVKRRTEKSLRSPGFVAALEDGFLPRPWHWRVVDVQGPPGRRWRVTASIWVRRARGCQGDHWWSNATQAPRPVHVGVTISGSDGIRWRRAAVTTRRAGAASQPQFPRLRIPAGIETLFQTFLDQLAPGAESTALPATRASQPTEAAPE